MTITEQQIREIVKQEVAALMSVQPKEVVVKTVVDPQIGAHSYTVDQIVKTINEQIVPNLNLLREAVQNLYALVVSPDQLSEPPSEES